MTMKKITDFDLSNKYARYAARKAGFDVPMVRRGPKPPELDSLIDKSGDCWEWLGKKNQWGYGKLSRNGKTMLAHREVYERENGPLPSGTVLMHKCDNPACVNPSHLAIGSHVLNQADKVSKDRQAKGERISSAKLSEEDVCDIRKLYQPRVVTYRMLADEYGVSKDTIQKAIRGINWKHL